MVKIGCVVSYCTNEYRFLNACLTGLKAISDEIVVSVCDHFFDGQKENRELLHKSYSENKDVRFVEYAYGNLYGLHGVGKEGDEVWSRHWHNTSRYVGFSHLCDDIDYVLFIDVDEIVEGERFLQWLEKGLLFEAMIFSSYVYLGDESRRALHKSNSYLLVKKEALQPQMLFDSHERPGFFLNFRGTKKSFVLGLDGKPLVHHFNWVRSQKELRQKVSTWGHKDERDWHKLIDEGRLEEGTDHTYSQVEPLFDLLSIDVESMKKASLFRKIPVDQFTHVTKTTKDQVMRTMIEKGVL